jgi:hypothetical protein
MAINLFFGEIDDNTKAALSYEIPYPKWVIVYPTEMEVLVYNGDDQPPSDEYVSSHNGTKTYYEFSTQE